MIMRFHQILLRKTRRLTRAIYRRAFQLPLVNKAIFTQVSSKGEMEDAQAYGTRSPIEIMNQGFEIDEVPSLMNRRYLQERFTQFRNSFKILYVGRIEPVQKGLDLLIAAIHKLVSADNRVDLCLFMFGSTHKKQDQQQVESLIKRFGLSEKVILPGFIQAPDKYHAMASADVFLHTSRWEGLPLSVLEAAACGVPCIVTPGSYVDDVVRKYDAGLTVDGDADSIAQGIKTALELPPSELKKKGTNARGLVEKEFSWKKTAKAMCDCYEKYLTEGRLRLTDHGLSSLRQPFRTRESRKEPSLL